MSLEVFGDEGDVPRGPLCEWEMWPDDDGPAFHCQNPDCPGDPEEDPDV